MSREVRFTGRRLGVDIYELGPDGEIGDLEEWLRRAARGDHRGRGAARIAFPFAVLVPRSEGDEDTTIEIANEDEVERLLESLPALRFLAGRGARKRFERWINRAWTVFEHAAAAREALAALRIPTVEETDAWWSELDEKDDEGHVREAEERRRSKPRSRARSHA